MHLISVHKIYLYNIFNVFSRDRSTDIKGKPENINREIIAVTDNLTVVAIIPY